MPGLASALGRRPTRAAALAAALLAAGGFARFDAAWAGADPAGPARFAVMGVRLYMNATQAEAVLRRQSSAVERRTHACAGASANLCTSLLRARMPDGVLTVRFLDSPPGLASGPETAWRVTLRLDPRQGANTSALREGAEAHYGPPDTLRPLLWCATPAPAGGACAADQPRLRLTDAPDRPVELRLSDPGLAARTMVQEPTARRVFRIQTAAPGG